MNFWKRYPADYRKKTARLTLAMHGAYTLLLDEVYITEDPLPPDIEELYQICHARTKLERDSVDTVAARYFPVGEDGQRHNARATEELEEAAPAVAAARKNGKKGGRPKSKPSENPAGSGSANPAGSQTETHNEPSSKPPQSSENSSSLRSEEGARKRTPRFDASKIELPPWLSREIWTRWCRDRKDRKKAITEEGSKAQLKRLAEYRASGHAPEDVLTHAMAGGTQGLFPPPSTGAKGQPAQSFRSQDVATKQSRTAELTGGIFPGPAEPAAADDVIEMEVGHARIAGR